MIAIIGEDSSRWIVGDIANGTESKNVSRFANARVLAECQPVLSLRGFLTSSSNGTLGCSTKCMRLSRNLSKASASAGILYAGGYRIGSSVFYGVDGYQIGYRWFRRANFLWASRGIDLVFFIVSPLES